MSSTSPLPTTPHPDAAVAALKPQPTDAPDAPPVAATTSRGATPASNCTPPPIKKPKKTRRKNRNPCTNNGCTEKFFNIVELEMHLACCPHRPEAAAPTPSLTLAQRGLGGGAFDKMKRIDEHADT